MSTNFETIHLSLSYLRTFIYSMPDPLQLHKGEFAKIVVCRIDRLHTHKLRAWCIKFATGLNTKIDIVQKVYK